MEMPKKLVDNYKTILSAITLVVTLSGAIFFIDDRYALAADVDQIQQSTELKIDELRIKQLQDKIFILEFKIQEGSASPLDKALREKYNSELQQFRAN